jgi:hypothetical protein
MADIEALDTFNGIIKRLVKFATSKSKKLSLGGAVRRVRLLLDDAPLAALTALAPVLEKNRTQVMNSDEKYFMEADFATEIPEEYEEDRKEIIFVITKLKKIYAQKCKPDEKKQILSDMKLLLLTYDTYMKKTSGK